MWQRAHHSRVFFAHCLMHTKRELAISDLLLIYMVWAATSDVTEDHG